jgi:tetratricopeptide (TPR) repeat protein
MSLHTQGKLPDAIAAYCKAIDVDPSYAMAYSNLGAALRAQHKLADAIAAYQKALDLDPTNASTCYNLGNALGDQQRLPDAIAAYRKAIEINPLLAEAHCNLGHALIAQGGMAQGLAALRRGDELGRRRPDWRDPSAEWVHNAERLTRLEANLPAILSGSQQPANAGENIQYAEVCNLKKLYASAAGLYEQALAAEPKLAEDLRTGNRYNAACAACLSAAGQGEDSAKLDDKQRAHWRKQAVAWLNADFALWAKDLAGAKQQARTTIQQTLRHWQEDTDLTGIREAAALAKLTAAEQAACQKLWEDVAALLKKAADKP